MATELFNNDKEEDQVDDKRSERSARSLASGNVVPRRKSMFGGYARLFRIVLARWMGICKQLGDEELQGLTEELILPSNEDWRQGVYYRLVELQRECDAELLRKRAVGLEAEFATEKELKSTVLEQEKKNEWECEPRVCSCRVRAKKRECRKEESSGSIISIRSIVGSMTEACVQPGWRVNDILLAARVLKSIPDRPTYSDEAEMRRVFGLVYDVFRYKKILIRALNDVGFWGRNSELKDQEKIVWLLLYDMQGRKFARRGEIADVEEREKAFEAAGLMDIENALLEAKTHLAASFSRLRIRGSALNLNELLPTRLRIIEGVVWGEEPAIASGWVNSKKFASKEEFLEEMSKLNMIFRENEETKELDEADYTFDTICPRVVNLHESARETLALSTLVRDHRFIFLERSLCLGAAALARAIRLSRLCGPIVLTHSLAPRHTGYLAELLDDIEDAGRLLAFGAGERRCEYETYLRDLGVTLQRCRVFSEKYVSPPATAELERATVVLAIPPCSYTGVRDIVDLAVARGGDVDLLESLTNCCTQNDEHDCNREIEQLRALLADQMSTLKYALTRPNVQFLIYEAHTILPSETTEMVRQVVDYANRMALEKHIRDHPSKKKLLKEGKESSKPGKQEKIDESVEDGVLTIHSNVTVPDSDLFEIGSIDVIYGENASRMLDPGCFLAVIKRKEMMQFDSLFMIKVAESKGLFGDPDEQRQKREPVLLDRALQRSTQAEPRKRAKRFKVEIDRLMAHTHSSLTRTTKENRICPRHKRYNSCRENIMESQVEKDNKENDICQIQTIKLDFDSSEETSSSRRRKTSMK
ncbi:uncharacterized protein LOC143188523 [Calliopsis andreniformis]|uniref:uncharacterized protein LOC143188523 n=1 Tax=Calliopsis andreniformis TaxID=337506 RepID=UPI003FCE06FB